MTENAPTYRPEGPPLADLLPEVAGLVPVEVITDSELGDGFEFSLGTAAEGPQGVIRLFPNHRLARIQGPLHDVTLQDVAWLEPVRTGVRLISRSPERKITVVAGVSGQIYVTASPVDPRYAGDH